ncbi:hypothetical protein HYV98_00800 [Candidatus Azambacteria bacterium]|nr:hypothetical protein [Candidatus Azambacteria bacterium]
MQIRILLAPVKKFPERARCSISDVVKNVDSFFQNFRNGGWRAWITVSTQPQNNIYGTYLLAVDERAQQEAAAKEAAQAEAESSQGFLSQKVCTQFHVRGSTIPVYGEFKAEELGPDAICDKFEIRTPGSTAGNLLSKALGLGPDSLVSAKEFEEYLGAIVNAAINRVIREGLATIGVKTPPITAAGPDVFPPESVNLAGESAIAPQLVLAQNNLRTTLQDQLIPAEATLVTRLFTLEDTQRRTLIAVQQLNDNACQLPDFAKKEVVGGEVIITAEGIGKLTVAGGKAVNPEAFATAQITTISQTSTQQSQQVETFLPIASGTVEQYIVKLKEYTRSLGSSREKALLNETLAARTIAFNNSRDAIFSAINDSNFFLRNDGGPSIFTETQNDAAAAQERVTQIQERIGDENANTGIFGEIASAREKRATADQLLASCIPTPTTVPATRITP